MLNAISNTMQSLHDLLKKMQSKSELICPKYVSNKTAYLKYSMGLMRFGHFCYFVYII